MLKKNYFYKAVFLCCSILLLVNSGVNAQSQCYQYTQEDKERECVGGVPFDVIDSEGCPSFSCRSEEAGNSDEPSYSPEDVSIMEQECENDNGVFEINGQLMCGHPENANNPDAVRVGSTTDAPSLNNGSTVGTVNNNDSASSGAPSLNSQDQREANIEAANARRAEQAEQREALMRARSEQRSGERSNRMQDYIGNKGFR